MSNSDLNHTGAASRRRRVRQLPHLAATIELSPLVIEIDPLELLEDLDPGLAWQLLAEGDHVPRLLA